MKTYERALRERVMPTLERMTGSLGLWKRSWEDAFETGITGDYGLPAGVYNVTIVRTGELTVQRINRTGATFSIFDDRAKAIYSTLEQLEKRDSSTKKQKTNKNTSSPKLS